MLAFGIEILTDQIADNAVTTPKLADGAVTNAKAADMAQSTVKGRAAGAGTGDPTDLTVAQVKTILGYASSEITYDNTISGLLATNVKTAIDELDSLIDALGSGMTFQGTFDAGGGAGPVNFPGGGTAQTGYFYHVINAAAGGTTLGSSNPIVVNTGDQIVAAVDNASATNGADWVKLDNTDSVTSVAGKVGAVTLEAADIINQPTDTLVGRDAAGTGAATAIGVGGGVEFSGSNALQTSAFTGDVTKPAGSVAQTIAANAVDNTKAADMAQGSIKGRAAGAGTGDPTDLTSAQVKAIITPILTADIGDDQVTYAKMQNISAASKLLGRGDSGSGDPEEITLGSGLSMSGATLSASGAGLADGDKGDITVSSGGTVWTIDNDVVTFAKIQNIATDRLLGRDTAGTGDPEEIAVSGGIEFTGAGAIQTSAFTGDVTKTAGGTALTIANDAVTFAKMQNILTDSLIGRDTAGTGDPENITLDLDMSMSAGKLQVAQWLIANSDCFRAAGFAGAFVTGATVSWRWKGVTTPSQITSNQNNYLVPDTDLYTVIRLSSDASRDITGLVPHSDSAFHLLLNVGSFNIVLVDESGSSTTTNRFSLPGGDLTIKPDEGVCVWYDGTSDRWRTTEVQLRALTGDVTGSGLGDIAATIAADVVTFAKMQNIGTDTLVGRDTAGTGDPESIGVTGGIEFTGSGSIQTGAFTGDATKAAGGTALTVVGTSGAFVYTGIISPASLGSNQQDYNPTGLSGASVLRLTASTTVTIGGLQGGATGRILFLHNIGSNPIILLDEAAGSSAANRFAFGGTTRAISTDEVVTLMYVATSPRWRDVASQTTNISGVVVGTSAGATTVTTFGTAVSAAAQTVLDDATVAAMVDTLGGAASTGTGGLVRANGPTFGAGSASAGTWPKFTGGTIMTTPEAGAIEYDSKVAYFSPEGSNRGVVGAEYFICLSGTNTLANSAAEQALFDSVGGGVLTLPVGTYFFESVISLSSMSGTSGNLAFDILGAGTAVLGSVLYRADGRDGAINNAVATTGSMMNQGQSPAAIVSAATSTELQVVMNGTFRITAAGTIIPSVTLANAAAAVVRIGSYFRCHCVGSQTVQTVGQWS